jgi:hypothetical protein
MGAPKFEDRVLGGLKPDVTISYQIENGANALNPSDPNADEIAITMTADGLEEFINRDGMSFLLFSLEVTEAFDKENINPNSDFYYDSYDDRFICFIPFSEINPDYPVIKTAILKIGRAAEPMSSTQIIPSAFIDFYWQRYYNSIPSDIANWTDPCSQTGVIYVNNDANESTSGTSWEYPYKTLQEALARAIMPNSGIGQIWLAAGTYTAPDGESFAIDKNIEIYGGFISGQTDVNQRCDVAGKTILTVSDVTKNVLRLSTENTPRTYVLDGLTITGSAYSGIYLHRNTLDIRHCVITGNRYGIIGDTSTLAMQDSVVTYNKKGIDMSFSGIALDRNIIAFNEEEGVELNNCGLAIVNSVVSENRLDGMFFESANTLTEIYNCNIVNNGQKGLNGLGGGATTKIKNCIVYGNGNNTIPTGNHIHHNIQTNPPFMYHYFQDSNMVVYYLSPDANGCIDTGTNNPVEEDYPLDLYGRERIVNNTVDIGAAEYGAFYSADFNLDGKVNFADFVWFANVWGLSSSEPNYVVSFDINIDDIIDFADMSILIAQWLSNYGYPDTVTSTYRLDFGYKAPEWPFSWMSMSENSFSIYSERNDFPVAEDVELQLAAAKNILKYSVPTLAARPLNIAPVIPQVNKVQQQQASDLVSSLQTMSMAVDSFGMECIEAAESVETAQEVVDVNILLDWLDDLWQKDKEVRNSMTEADYLDFRNSIEKSSQ